MSNIKNIFLRLNPISKRFAVFALIVLILLSLVFFSFYARLALAQVTSQPSVPKSPIPSPVDLFLDVSHWAQDAVLGVFGDFIKGTLGNAVLGVLAMIAKLCHVLVGLAAAFLNEMLRPDLYDFPKEKMIDFGWQFIRNVCNLFFLVILLFIAFCTILQIDKYHAKKTLLTLILMALLINFSRPIAIFIFDGSQLLMNFFLGQLGKDTAAAVADISRIADMLYKDLPGAKDWMFSNSSTVWDLSLQYLIKIILLFIFAVALFSMALFLLIRIVAMWLLIIVSPLAFLGTAVPDFRNMASKWWDALFKYSYYGPAAAFFILLSTKLIDSSFLKNFKSQPKSFIKMEHFIPYMVTVIFLYASVMMAQQFGIQFASTITGYADRAIKGFAGYVTGYRAARWTGRKAWQGTKLATQYGLEWGERKLLMAKKPGETNLSPRAWIRGWRERAAEMNKQALDVAAGVSRDSLHKAIDNTETHFGQLAIDRITATAEKRYSEHSGEFAAVLGPELAKLVGSKKENAAEEISGILRIACKNRDPDEVVKLIRNYWDVPILGNGETFHQLFDRIKPTDWDKGERMTFDDMIVDDYNVASMIEVLLRATVGEDERAMQYIYKVLSDLGEISAPQGSILHSATKRDEQAVGNKLKRTKRLEMAHGSAKKHLTIFGERDKAIRSWRGRMTTEFGGLMGTGEINTLGLDDLQYVSPAALAHITYTNSSKQYRCGRDMGVADSTYMNLAAEKADDGIWRYEKDGEKKERKLMLWNEKLNDGEGGEDLIINPDQAYKAAAVYAGLQAASGFKPEQIAERLRHYKFDMARICSLMKEMKNNPLEALLTPEEKKKLAKLTGKEEKDKKAPQKPRYRRGRKIG